MDILKVSLEQLCEPAQNPNSMGDSQFKLLCDNMLRIGYVQPILARKIPDTVNDSDCSENRYEIVDGVHRARAVAALMALSPDNVPDHERDALKVFQKRQRDGVDVVVSDLDATQARLVQVGMNRLRGELDLGDVARTLAELSDLGSTIDSLTLAGFDASEIADLISAIKPEEELTPEDGMGATEPKPEKPIKPFIIELTFATEEERNRAKKGLKKAAGKGKDMSEGLLNLLDGVS